MKIAKTYLYVLLVSCWEIDDLFLVKRFTDFTWAYLVVWILSLFVQLVLNIKILLKGPRSRVTSLIVCVGNHGWLVRQISWLLQWTSSSICRDTLFYTFNLIFQICLGLIICIRLLLSIWSHSNKWRSNSVNQHVLSIKLHFKRFSLFNNFIDPLTQIRWLKVCSSLRTLIFLASVIIGINPFVIIEVYVFFIISGSLFMLLLLGIDQVFFVVWQLINIISVFLMCSVVLEVQIILLSVDSSLLMHLLIHFSYNSKLTILFLK